MSKISLMPETAQRIDVLVGRAQRVGRVPSLLLGVVRDGALAHVAAAGDVPADPAGTQYRIGSITKTMTAALVLMLRDEGRLALDDLLYRHLPGTPVGGVTLRQLLGHLGGLQREPDGAWWERTDGVDVDTFLAELTPDQLPYPPYRGHHYSNLAYGLLGAVVSRIVGESWPTLATKWLLEPLGLERTTYREVEPFAPGYVIHPWHGTPHEQPRTDAGAMAPAGQLWSTLTDLARWTGFLADPDPNILAGTSVAEMCAPVVLTDLESWTAGHGLGVQLWRRGDRVYVGHTGAMPGYLAMTAVHRPSRTGVVAFANAYTLHGDGIVTLALNALTAVLDREPVPPTPWRPAPGGTGSPPADVLPLLGRWWWMGREFEVAWDDRARELVMTPITVPERHPWCFRPDGTDRWRCRSGTNDGEILRVHRAPGGAVTALSVATVSYTREP